MYTSASPLTTAIDFAPAEPISINVPSIFFATLEASIGGRDLLTTIRIFLPSVGELGSKKSLQVEKVEFKAGIETAPTTGRPSTARATCTAQSSRRGSPNSLVPSSGSTIHTRFASLRSGWTGFANPSSERTPSFGLNDASSSMRKL